ncbi:MAG: DUF1667 domain-containing protein [Clostridia bacterium]|nr:DUF1667 domain-containing protein [Clostridia bacterium]
MKTICINCPMGCKLEITKQGEEIVVTGNGCIRGIQYGKEEITAPKRVVTSLIKTDDMIYSVKTSKPIPKEMIFDVIKCIQETKTTCEYEIGDKVTEDILKTGADLKVTGKNKIHKKG